jgi:hypothetical protein
MRGISIPPNGSPQSLSTQDVGAWLRAAHERRAQLHRHAAGSWHSAEPQAAFLEMSGLLQEAFEEVRIISEAVREESQCVRSTAAALRAHATGLMERGTTLMARMAQLPPPAPEEIRHTESRLLAMFRGGHTPRPL